MDCKYMLPCGRCDKHGEVCEALMHEIEMIQEEFDRYKEEHCEHDWYINGRLFGKDARYTMHTCTKCGKEETLKTYIDEDNRWITHSV